MQEIAPRNPMPAQPAEVRNANFKEVALGYTEELARAEAERCIQCKKPPCRRGCPVEIDIPAFIKLITEGKFLQSILKIREKNNLPAVCGRVCPQESQCEKFCTIRKKYGAVAIGRLERFVADNETKAKEEGRIQAPAKPTTNGKKVAVVGAGPAGLTCAADLAKLGFAVTVFESLHDAGGVLRYGIPEFRLPKHILDVELDYIRALGVEIRCNMVIGRIKGLEEMLAGEFDAVFLGTGAGLPYFLGIPGENLNGVYSANEFLTRVNLMKAYQFPRYDTPVTVGNRVVVVGAGNVAMDSARVAKRLGAEVTIVYRRGHAEMPARLEEIEHAEEEGINFHLLTSPVEILGNNENWVDELKVVKMELGEPDESGRRRPIPVPGSEYTIEVDTIVIAVGQGPNPLLQQTTPQLKVNRRGNIVVKEDMVSTSIDGVFAGGDIVTGAATVILAMGAGKKAARAIAGYLGYPQDEPTEDSN